MNIHLILLNICVEYTQHSMQLSNRHRCINKMLDKLPPESSVYTTSPDRQLPISVNRFNTIHPIRASTSLFSSSSQFLPNDGLVPIKRILHFTLLIIPLFPSPLRFWWLRVISTVSKGLCFWVRSHIASSLWLCTLAYTSDSYFVCGALSCQLPLRRLNLIWWFIYAPKPIRPKTQVWE